MKKNILFIALVCVIGAVAAQDTVRYGDSNYYFMPTGNPIRPPYIPNTCPDLGAPHCGGYMENHVERPMLVYGIAVTSPHTPHFYFCNEPFPDTTNIHLDFYAMLGIKEGGIFYHVDSAKWYPRSLNRYYVYERVQDWRLHNGEPFDSVVPVYEFYFKTPRLVVDTFYVGLLSTHAHADSLGHLDHYA